MLVAVPLLAALMAKILGMYGNYLTGGSVLSRTFAAVGEHWLLVAILSLLVNVAAASISSGRGVP